MPFFVAGLFVGTLIGGFVASLFAVSARERGIEDADALANELARDEKLERDFSR